MRGISGRLTPVAVAVLLAACPAFAAQINFDNTAGTGVWETPANWSTDTLPTTADQPVIHDSFTASITSAQVAGDLVVSWPTGLGAPAAGTATLNIGPGANLVVGNPPDNTNTSGIRVGRTATAVGASLGVVNQTGGSVSIVTGANGLRLSQADAGTTVSDSRYVISGGTLRGGHVRQRHRHQCPAEHRHPDKQLQSCRIQRPWLPRDRHPVRRPQPAEQSCRGRDGAAASGPELHDR